MNKKTLAIVGGVLLVVLVACGGLGVVGYTKLLKPAIALASATEEMKDFKTGEFTFSQSTTMEMSFLGELEGLVPAQSLKTTLEGEGKVDIEAKKLYMKSGGEVDGEEISDFEYYIIGDDVYIVTDGSVEKLSMQEAIELYSDSIEDFDSFSSNQIWTTISVNDGAEYLGETTVDGEEVYEFQVPLTEKDLKNFNDALTATMVTSLGADGTEVNTAIEGEIDYKVYVSKKGGYPVKETIMIPELKIEFVDLMELLLKDFTMSFVYSNVNQDVEIEAPSN